MTIEDLLGIGGRLMVLEGAAVGEFADQLESAGQIFGVPIRHIRRARKIVGAPVGTEYITSSSELIGQFGGRLWYAEYSSDRRRKAIQHYRHRGQTLDRENCLRCNSAWRARKRWKRERRKA